jgi:hypothetical protein
MLAKGTEAGFGLDCRGEAFFLSDGHRSNRPR